jgi:hypothetical protein
LHDYVHPSSTVLAGIYLKSGNVKDALAAAKEALAAAKAHGDVHMEVESLILQAKVRNNGE